MRNLRSFVSVGLAALCALLVAAPAHAQEGTLKKIKETGAITLGHRFSTSTTALPRLPASRRAYQRGRVD